ncbi:acetolactate decarboxylase [Kaistella pullorum]|uniref:Acetolactate decarboxylase n=1 Tax=Kaistella pullorum TaxID=2763074 RepID=A0ABR8WM23_9FLAO|nr:acetolactate decarboxylase [Kaistella pullorum]MBD8018122.1 acetolactate decarboxylase [Kaistella pullorum]
MNFKRIIAALGLLALSGSSIQAQKNNKDVKVIGQMKNVMWKGELFGNIHLDTIANRKNLYGFGPVEYLAGEILIIDGKSYKSTVTSDAAMKVEETYDIKAPFFAYANISDWSEQSLPETVQNLEQLETYLDSITKDSPRPFMFKLKGTVEQATVHIVNLPEGSKVSSPDEAHQGQVNYKLQNEKADIIGFFSTKHKAIFTHHDTFLHMHLITKDRRQLGHLDEVTFKPGTVKLYLPK